MSPEAVQDLMTGNHCWGCGADNPEGLQLKSYWDGDVAIADWQPRPAHAAGPWHVLNGGIIATVLDCHGVCTAVANLYQEEGRTVGSEPQILCATASMTVEYLRPTPIDESLRLTAEVVDRRARLTVVDCVLESAGKERARASVEVARLAQGWRENLAGRPHGS